MTIEEKLDWILQKVKDGKFDLGKVDDKTKKIGDQTLRQELYPNLKPLSDEEKLSIHEWVQLKDKLISEDKLIEEFAFSFGGKYILTVKGKLFSGYKRQKKDTNRRRTIEIIHQWTLTIGTALAGLYAAKEVAIWIHHHYQ